MIQQCHFWVHAKRTEITVSKRDLYTRVHCGVIHNS